MTMLSTASRMRWSGISSTFSHLRSPANSPNSISSERRSPYLASSVYPPRMRVKISGSMSRSFCHIRMISIQSSNVLMRAIEEPPHRCGIFHTFVKKSPHHSPMSPASSQPVRSGRRQGPALAHLRPRSMLFTLFGDYVFPIGGEIWLGSLVAIGRALGMSEVAVRSAVARLARERWVAARKHGQRSFYRLAPKGRALIEEGTQRIYHGDGR